MLKPKNYGYNKDEDELTGRKKLIEKASRGDKV